MPTKSKRRREFEKSLVTFDRTAFQVYNSFEEADDADREYWRSRTPLERMIALEHIRQSAWGYDDTMYQATTVQDGHAVERNFDKFPVSRMNEYPKQINIAFMKTNRWITGAGEEAIPQIPPAILNAVFKITGKRFRSIPLKNHDLSWG